MRLVSYQMPAGAAGFGVLTGDDRGIADLSMHADSLKAFLAESDWEAKAEAASAGAADTTLDAVRLLPVIPDPAKIFCVGVNYASHLLETGRELPEKPMIFTRTAQSQTAHDAAMIRPRVSEMFDFEAELAIVISKPMRYVSPAAAMDGVAGYSCYNDGSIRDWQRHTGQFTPGKNFPATGSFGPWLATRDAFGAVGPQKIIARLNGEVMQEGRLDDLIFSVGELISYISHFCELEPGDIIISGTTGGVGAFRQPPIWMKAGDMVEVEIEGIGILKNRIEDEQGAADCYW